MGCIGCGSADDLLLCLRFVFITPTFRPRLTARHGAKCAKRTAAPCDVGGPVESGLVGFDRLGILHAEPEVGIAMHHASVHLGHIAVRVNPHFVNGVAVRQADFVAAGKTILRRPDGTPEAIWNTGCRHASQGYFRFAMRTSFRGRRRMGSITTGFSPHGSDAPPEVRWRRTTKDQIL